jgi:peptidoglycan/LPS O-acetylase OafA/YrhL
MIVITVSVLLAGCLRRFAPGEKYLFMAVILFGICLGNSIIALYPERPDYLDAIVYFGAAVLVWPITWGINVCLTRIERDG